MRLIGLVNVSTVVPDSEVQPYIDAQVHQLHYHLCPAWGRVAPTVVKYASLAEVPAGAQVVVIYDNSDQQGALAYHSENSKGLVFSRVFAKTLIDNGDTWTSGASHEVCEMTIDPSCNLSADDGRSSYAFEVCDPVESTSYAVNGVLLSDFVHPPWFDTQAPAGTRTRHVVNAGNLAPLHLAKGGYVIRDGQPVFGEEYPSWRTEMKGADSRADRRLA